MCANRRSKPEKEPNDIKRQSQAEDASGKKKLLYLPACLRRQTHQHNFLPLREVWTGGRDLLGQWTHLPCVAYLVRDSKAAQTGRKKETETMRVITRPPNRLTDGAYSVYVHFLACCTCVLMMHPFERVITSGNNHFLLFRYMTVW